MSESLKSTPYIEAVADTSGRTRGVYYLVLVSSVVVFMAFWNTRPGNWLSERGRTVSSVYRWYPWDESRLPGLSAKERSSFERSKANGSALGIQPESDVEFAKENRELLKEGLKEIRKHLIQNSIVNVPFFGVSIDINDLGLLAGLTFFAVLLMLRASLWRQLANFAEALKAAKQYGEMREAYALMSMSQVFTVPPQRELKHDPYWIRANKLFLIMPFFVQTMSCVVNFMTIPFGWTLNAGMTVIQEIGGIVFVVLIGWLTYECIKLSSAYSAQWIVAAGELGIVSEAVMLRAKEGIARYENQ